MPSEHDFYKRTTQELNEQDTTIAALRAQIARLEAELAEAREEIAKWRATISPYPYACNCRFENDEDQDEPTKWCAMHAKIRDDLSAAQRKLEECENLRQLIENLLVCTHRPNPTNRDEIRIAPGKGAEVSRIMNKLGRYE